MFIFKFKYVKIKKNIRISAMKRVGADISPELANKLKVFCKKNGMKQGWLIEKLIKDHLEKNSLKENADSEEND